MFTATKPLLSLTAADLMSQPLVLIPQEMSLPAAARLLSMHQVSGAPVVDNCGVCIGVLSSFDFVNWAGKGKQTAKKNREFASEYCQSWQVFEPDELPQDAVGNFMTLTPVTVSPETGLVELARMMVDAHIHRVIVVDTECHPLGIVSSTDILAALAFSNPMLDQPFEKGGGE